MSFLFEILAKTLLKGLGPIDGWKTAIGFGLALAAYVAGQFGIVIPQLGNEWLEIIGVVLGAFGLGHKGGKAIAG